MTEPENRLDKAFRSTRFVPKTRFTADLRARLDRQLQAGTHSSNGWRPGGLRGTVISTGQQGRHVNRLPILLGFATALIIVLVTVLDSVGPWSIDTLNATASPFGPGIVSPTPTEFTPSATPAPPTPTPTDLPPSPTVTATPQPVVIVTDPPPAKSAHSFVITGSGDNTHAGAQTACAGSYIDFRFKLDGWTAETDERYIDYDVVSITALDGNGARISFTSSAGLDANYGGRILFWNYEVPTARPFTIIIQDGPIADHWAGTEIGRYTLDPAEYLPSCADLPYIQP